METYAVLFDLDGTLLDSTGAYFEITRRACVELGWPAPGVELMREVMTRRRHPVEVLFGPVADAPARQQALSAAALKLWQPVFLELAHPFPDAVAVLDTLHRAGLRLGIVTDSNDFVVRRIAEAPGCPPFDVVVTRERAGARKPSPAGIRLALAELGVAPGAALYVGDNPADIEAARAAGVRVLGITTGPSRREDLEPHGPEGVLDRLTELPGLLRTGGPAVSGRLVRGRGEAGGFLRLPWVRTQLEAWLGGEYFPGTVNLEISAAAAQVVARHREDPLLHWHEVQPADGYCRAVCHRVDLVWDGAAALPALALWPQVADYPDTQLELVCRVPLRARHALRDGDTLTVRYRRR